MMKTPGEAYLRIGMQTDSRKKLVFEAYANGSRGNENDARSFNAELDVIYKPTNYLSFTVIPAFSKSGSELQYVSQTEYNNYDKYIFASIERKTISTSFRINLNLSPDLTIQYWGQPFIASGRYFDHKYILNPMSDSYSDRFMVFTPEQISADGDNYNIDENKDGTADYRFEKRDFNVQEFLSNFVVRWEYNPGSSLYLVWSQTRSSSNSEGSMNFVSDLGDLFDAGNNKPHNVFLIKFSYRFGIK
jgi:hypothetical protein